MAVNKVVFGAVSIMDISDSTVTPETLAEGKTAYQADGEKITGTMKSNIDTSDATATASDIKSGKTAYVNGKKVSGSLQKVSQVLSTNEADENGVSVGKTLSGDISYCSMSYKTKRERYYETGALVNINADFENFGDATAEDVISGKTFTSESGLKVPGSLYQVTGGWSYTKQVSVSEITKNEIRCVESSAKIDTPRAFAKDSYVRVAIPLTQFGNATPEDVAKGKTFTSVAGLLVVGTKEESTADPTLNAEVQTIADVTAPTATFNGTGGTYKVYGFGKGATIGYTTPKYAFCGDKYYKMASYGNDTTTTLSITVDESGNISGLPSLTDGELTIVRIP